MHRVPQLGLDYVGPTVGALPEYRGFEAALRVSMPERFVGAIGQVEYGSQYAFPLVEGATLRSSALNEAPEDAIAASVVDLMTLLDRSEDEVIAVRIVTNIDVAEPVEVGPVQIRPVGQGGLRSAFRLVDSLIPGTLARIHEAIQWGPLSFQFALLLTRSAAPRSTAMHGGYEEAAHGASQLISSALTAIRVATSATAETLLEVVSPPGFMRLRDPQIAVHPHESFPLIQRVPRIDGATAASIARLADGLDRSPRGPY